MNEVNTDTNICNCTERKDLLNNFSLFAWDEEYKWVLSWVEITSDAGCNQIHRYGISIKFCPMCGGRLPDSQ